MFYVFCTALCILYGWIVFLAVKYYDKGLRKKGLERKARIKNEYVFLIAHSVCLFALIFYLPDYMPYLMVLAIYLPISLRHLILKD